MSRLLPAAILCCAAAIGGTAYGMLGESPVDRIVVPAGGAQAPEQAPPPPPRDDVESLLQRARRSGSKAALDEVVARLQAETQGPAATSTHHRLLARALLERVMQHSQWRGLVVGQPVYETLPKQVARDLDAATTAIARARELGDDTGELYRTEAALMSHRITGLASALQWNSKIQQALAKAAERCQDDPQLHTALGLRKLLAPPFLGQDLGKALDHFEYAAKALLDDERPAVFAAMASSLQQKQQQAIGWLEQAVQRNPQNVFARTVLARLRRGEADPFGRDVTPAEAAAAK
jgi:tetratricopeptide (TPR) repeat protein